MGEIESEPLWSTIQRTGMLAGRAVHCLSTVSSTNALALEESKAGAATGTVWVAETQTAGRGRLGKHWASPPGTGLYCTVLLRPTLPVDELCRLTLTAGLATARAIEEVSGLACAIKWPNDVLVNGKKVAGILAECQLAGSDAPVVALGVGINLTTTIDQLPPELRDKATSLWLASGKTIDKGEMLAALLGWIDRLVLRLEQGDFAGILAEWRTKDATIQKKLTWLTTDGRAVCGVSLGPDAQGVLVIRDSEGGYHHVLSGDLLLDPNTLSGYFP